MTPELVAAIILAVICGAQAYWINTLLNKLMSRNYHEYQVAQAVPTTLSTPPQEKFDDSMEEDLNHIG